MLKNLDIFFYEIRLLFTYLQPDECYANRGRSPRHEENITFDGYSAGLINGRDINVLVPWVGQISPIELFEGEPVGAPANYVKEERPLVDCRLRFPISRMIIIYIE